MILIFISTHGMFLIDGRRCTRSSIPLKRTKDSLQKEGFALFPLSTHVPTFCVWEMGPVCHEQQAWVRYLLSERNEDAKVAYVNDRFSGLI